MWSPESVLLCTMESIYTHIWRFHRLRQRCGYTEYRRFANMVPHMGATSLKKEIITAAVSLASKSRTPHWSTDWVQFMPSCYHLHTSEPEPSERSFNAPVTTKQESAASRPPFSGYMHLHACGNQCHQGLIRWK